MAAVVAILIFGSGGAVVSTTTDTPAPPAPNPATMPAAGAALWSTVNGPLTRLPQPLGWAVALAGGTAVVAPGIGNLDSEAADSADTVLGLNARTGAMRWRWRHKGWRLQAIDANSAEGVAAALWITSPDSDFEHVGGSYALTVFDLRSGRLKWTHERVGTGQPDGRVVLIGSMVVALADSTASAFDVSDGRPVWRSPAPAGCDWLMAPDGYATGGEITLRDQAVLPYVCGDSANAGGIERLALATGSTIWQSTLPDAPLSVRQTAGAVAVIVRRGVNPVAQVFDASSGRLLWQKRTVPITEGASWLMAVDRTGGVYLVAPRHDQSAPSVLVCIDALSGRVQWSTPLAKAYAAQSVGVVGGQVVLGGTHMAKFGSPRTTLQLFSAATGKPLARQRTRQLTGTAFKRQVMSNWDSALALEPGLAVMSTSNGHDVLGAFSLPQLTGSPS